MRKDAVGRIVDGVWPHDKEATVTSKLRPTLCIRVGVQATVTAEGTPQMGLFPAQWDPKLGIHVT